MSTLFVYFISLFSINLILPCSMHIYTRPAGGPFGNFVKEACPFSSYIGRIAVDGSLFFQHNTSVSRSIVGCQKNL